MTRTATLITLTELRTIACAPAGRQKRLRVAGMGFLSGCNGDVALSCGGGKHPRRLVRLIAPRMIRFGRPPFSYNEKLSIKRLLTVLDPAARLRTMTADGKRVRVEIFGWSHPIDLTNSHTIILREAELSSLLPQYGEAPSPSTAPSLEGELY